MKMSPSLKAQRCNWNLNYEVALMGEMNHTEAYVVAKLIGKLFSMLANTKLQLNETFPDVLHQLCS